MASEWYYMSGDKPTGPYSLGKLKQVLSSGSLPPTTLVWTDTMSAWMPSNTMAEFAPATQPAPPRLPEPVHVVPSIKTATENENIRAIRNEPPSSSNFDVQSIIGDEKPNAPAYKPATAPTVRPFGFTEKPSLPTQHPSHEKSKLSASKYLVSLRQSTCYAALRLVINVCFWIGMILLIIVAVGSVLSLFIDRNNSPGMPSVLMLFGPILAGVLLVAWRDASVLLIDVADTLLHDHARKLSHTGDRP